MSLMEPIRVCHLKPITTTHTDRDMYACTGSCIHTHTHTHTHTQHTHTQRHTHTHTQTQTHTHTHTQTLTKISSFQVLSVWSLHVLPVPAWVYSGYSGFPHHHKDMHCIV